MSIVKNLTLNTGAKFPSLGYGTFLSKPGEIGGALKKALEVGYRHIDCAAVYENEAEIGQVLSQTFKDGKIKREDLFITSKLWINKDSATPDKIRGSLQKTLDDLQLKYLDLYLIHIPVIVEKIDPSDKKSKTRAVRNAGFGLQDVYRKLEAAYDDGLIKAIGVSNFNVQTLNDTLTYCRVPPAVNQIELNPYLSQPELRQFCADNNVTVTAYAPLGAPGLMEGKTDVPVLSNDTIVEIAKKHNKTPAQVLIRWAIEIGVAVIPKSVKDHRIAENFESASFELSKEEVEAISKLDKSLRLFKQDWMSVPLFF